MQKITANTAKKLVCAGEMVYACASNLRPFTPWHCEQEINIGRLENIGFWEAGKKRPNNFEKAWQRFINAFMYYNCASSETGLQVAFYVK